jgi:hypothetical protein
VLRVYAQSTKLGSPGTGCAFGFSCGKGDFMKDIQTLLEKLRREAAECLVLSNVAADPEKRQLFARFAEHITRLASAVQNEAALQPANVVRAAETAVVDQKQATYSRQMLPWFVVVILLAAAGALAPCREGCVFCHCIRNKSRAAGSTPRRHKTGDSEISVRRG